MLTLQPRGMLLLVLLCGLPDRLPADGSKASRAGAKPNVILCMADDLGWGDVGFNGNDVIRTPNLDAAAAAGLKFTRFYAAAPVCSPTRGSALTGRHPYRYGVFSANAGHMPPQELTLAELLREHGYATGHFGKWHLGTLTTTEEDSNRGGPRGKEHFSPPSENGFDVCFSTEAKVPTWDPMWRPKSVSRRTWWDPVDAAANALPYGTAYWSNGKRVAENLRGDDSRLIMDRAIGFIRDAAKGSRPFLAVIWFHAPHLPVVAGPEYTKLYPGRSRYEQHYFGCITALDEQVGRLRRELRDLGVAEDTMLWFCSDNGPEGRFGKAPGSAGPLRGRKRDLFEGGIRVPAFLEWPARVRPGRTTGVPATTSDYFPTVLEALEVEATPGPQPLDGVSLLPLIEGRMKARPRPIAFESGRQRALIDNRYKLVRIEPGRSAAARRKKSDAGKKSQGRSTTMLFELIADPAEKQNLAGRRPQVVHRMSEKLESWRASCRHSLAGRDYSQGAPRPSAHEDSRH